MGLVEGEKLLGAHVKIELADRFVQQSDERGYKIKRSLFAAAKLWIELPPEVQSRLLDQSLDTNSFIELVRQIADEQIEKGRQAGRALLARQKRNKPRKG